MTQQQKVKDVMTTLIDMTNRMGSDKETAEGLVQAFYASHPTLSQSFMRAFRAAMITMEESPVQYFSDGRLRGSDSLAKAIANHNDPIPFI